MGGVVLTFVFSLSTIVAVFIATGENMPFQYRCFISRIPIFLFGILMYGRIDVGDVENHSCGKVMWIGMVVGILFLMVDRLSPFSVGFIATAMIAPALIYGLALLYRHINKSLLRIIRFLGIYSLEFYAANLIIYVTIDIISSTIAIKVTYYIIGNIVFALLLIPFNKLVSKSLSRIYIR